MDERISVDGSGYIDETMAFAEEFPKWEENVDKVLKHCDDDVNKARCVVPSREGNNGLNNNPVSLPSDGEITPICYDCPITTRIPDNEHSVNKTDEEIVATVDKNETNNPSSSSCTLETAASNVLSAAAQLVVSDQEINCVDNREQQGSEGCDKQDCGIDVNKDKLFLFSDTDKNQKRSDLNLFQPNCIESENKTMADNADSSEIASSSIHSCNENVVELASDNERLQAVSNNTSSYRDFSNNVQSHLDGIDDDKDCPGAACPPWYKVVEEDHLLVSSPPIQNQPSESSLLPLQSSSLTQPVSIKITSLPTNSSPGPSSPHLRMRYSTLGEPAKSKRTPTISSDDIDSDNIEADFPSSVSKISPNNKSVHSTPHHHQRSKTSKFGGCFYRIGHLGLKKKRKHSSSRAEDKNANVNNFDDSNVKIDLVKSHGDKENFENSCLEGNKTVQGFGAVGKIPRVSVEETTAVSSNHDETNNSRVEGTEPIANTSYCNPCSFDTDNNNNNNNSNNNNHTVNNNDNVINNNNNSNNNSGSNNNSVDSDDKENNNNNRTTRIVDQNQNATKLHVDNNNDAQVNETGEVEDKGENRVEKEEAVRKLQQAPEVTEHSEEVDTVSATLLDGVDPFKFSRSRTTIRPGSFRFRRAFSQRTRMKPLLENVVSGANDKDKKGGGDGDDDDDDIGDLDAVQFTAAADDAGGIAGRRNRRNDGTFHRRAFSLKRHFHGYTSSSSSSSFSHSSSSSQHLNSAGSNDLVHKGQGDNQLKGENQAKNGVGEKQHHLRHHHHHHHQQQHHHLHRSQSLKTQLMSFFVNLYGNDRGNSPFSRTGSVNKHSLASVELSSWASRGSTRRSGTLTPFSSSTSPLGMTTRAEILQTISSAIIHLFQRKRLKENELGLLQEHVRFLIEAEAGELVYEYYKDQLLRKGMVILREKIKNEQGLDLLTMLGETWDYFFREILPNLQAILYPLSPVMTNDETIRSLSLLAFRNIVVLKVSIREALDSVEKHSYPPSIKQMLLILQGITDNVFLSENQFLLEKLVARVVCPYMGQRGVYEGGPEPVIKVKLKPLPLNIPLASPGTQEKAKPSAPGSPKPAFIPHSSSSATKKAGAAAASGQNDNGEGGLKLKTVMEHLHDNGRRHSVVS